MKEEHMSQASPLVTRSSMPCEEGGRVQVEIIIRTHEQVFDIEEDDGGVRKDYVYQSQSRKLDLPPGTDVDEWIEKNTMAIACRANTQSTELFDAILKQMSIINKKTDCGIDPAFAMIEHTMEAMEVR